MERAVLVERAARGDAEAFRQLVVGHRNLVQAICLSEVVQAADAEELTQEVFVRVYRDLASLRDPEKFLPWLRRVARNVCHMWLRRRRPALVPLVAAAARSDPAAVAQLKHAELMAIVDHALSQLSAKSREVLVLHYLAGCSEAEIAALLGLRIATVKSRLHEGREQAKRQLLPVVEELLSLQRSSAELARQVMARCDSPGCICPDVLTERR